MENVIYIDSKNYEEYSNLNVIAFSYAHGGAMGCGGEIIVITKDTNIYSMNYVYGDMELEMCDVVCPPLKDCVFGFFDVEKTPEGYKGVALGAGNFLVLAEPIYNQLKKEMLIMPPEIRYGRWMEMVLNLLRKSDRA